MSKKSREAIKANLERAIAPSVPSQPSKRSSHLDGLLDEYAPPEESNPPLSPTPNVSLTPDLSPTPNAWHTPRHDYALRGVGHASRAWHTPNVRLNENQVDLWASVPEQKGYSKFHNAIIDSVYRLLDPIEQAIYTQLFRLSHGFDKPTCIISLPKLAERANIGTTATHNGIKRLITKNLVEKKTYIVGKGKEQGIEFSLTFPAWLTPNASHARDASHAFNAPIKDKDLKHTHTHAREDAHEAAETAPPENSPAAVAVCVEEESEAGKTKSRFTFAECRRYAESLRQEGIVNPGGYATKLHRSGEADSSIEIFLTPPIASPTVNTSQCPDCHGTGFWYPQGKENGVAKCQHRQLKQLASDK